MPPRSTDSDPRSDRELLRAYREGDDRAFERLYDRHAQSVFAFAYRYCGDHTLAEDVVQDCFRDLIDRIDSFELSGRLTSWFYVVAKRRALRLRRKIEREQGGLESTDAETLRIDVDARAGEAGDLAKLFCRLPAAQQEVLALRFVDGWELTEIAAALELPLGTVKSRLHNGLARLREDPGCRRYFSH